MRYLTCRRCRLKVKTEERFAVPWDEGDMAAQVKALLPEGQAVALRDKGITELPLARLNARLAPQGYVICARKGRDAKRLAACTGEDGRVEQFGLFELWSTTAGRVLKDARQCCEGEMAASNQTRNAGMTIESLS